MMGDGSSGSMMGSTTWPIARTGNTFTGTMQVGAHDGGTMTVSGMIYCFSPGAPNGRTKISLEPLSNALYAIHRASGDTRPP